jgi:hypothetical protein
MINYGEPSQPKPEMELSVPLFTFSHSLNILFCAQDDVESLAGDFSPATSPGSLHLAPAQSTLSVHFPLIDSVQVPML